jgi:ketosteroid isomerase-like protein
LANSGHVTISRCPSEAIVRERSIIAAHLAGDAKGSMTVTAHNSSRQEKPLAKILIAVAMLVLTSGPASATDKIDAMAIAQKWADTFNKGDFKSDTSVCADDAVIVDDFSPHVWQGRGACTQWYSAFLVYAKTAITDAKITLGDTQHLDIDSGYGYLVATVTLTYRKAGKPIKEAGIVTMTMHNIGTGWRMTSMTWADR